MLGNMLGNIQGNKSAAILLFAAISSSFAGDCHIISPRQFGNLI
jgi:hypothetical protein